MTSHGHHDVSKQCHRLCTPLPFLSLVARASPEKNKKILKQVNKANLSTAKDSLGSSVGGVGGLAFSVGKLALYLFRASLTQTWHLHSALARR